MNTDAQTASGKQDQRRPCCDELSRLIEAMEKIERALSIITRALLGQDIKK